MKEITRSKTYNFNNKEYIVNDFSDEGVIIYENNIKIKQILVYEYAGHMYMDGMLLLVGHDDDICMFNFSTKQLIKKRFR